MWEKISGAGGAVLGCAGALLGMVVIGSILAYLVYGGAWIGAKVYPWLVTASSIALAFSVIVLLPLSFFRRTRPFSAIGFVLASFVFGAVLWVWALLLTYNLWGVIAVVIGLFLLGIGVVPVAMAATAFNGMWAEFGQLILCLAIVVGVRIFGTYLENKS